MFNPKILHPPRLTYSILFNDTSLPYSHAFPSYYDVWMEYVFEHIKDQLLSQQYLIIVNTMRVHRLEYLDEMVYDVYGESLRSSNDDMEDCISDNPTEYTCAHALWDYLSNNEEEVKRNMFAIASDLIFNIFHPLHRLLLEVKKYDIYFSDILMEDKGNDKMVTCYTDLEVIKRYDKDWYDRLSLLTTV